MQRTPGQRIAVLFTRLLYLAGAGCGIAAMLIHVKTMNDPLRGALIATALYLLGSGAVLQLALRIARRHPDSDAA